MFRSNSKRGVVVAGFLSLSMSMALPASASTSGAPVITRSPSGTNAVVGTALTLYASAEGHPVPSVQWYLSTGHEWSAVKGATRGSLIVTPKTVMTEVFRAVFTNRFGSATTKVALVIVSAVRALAITSQPANSSTPLGAQAKFAAAAIGTRTPTVQWYMQLAGAGVWTPIADLPVMSRGGLTKTAIVVTATISSTMYKATFTNSAGSISTTPATLTAIVPAPTNEIWTGWVDTVGTFSAVSATWVVPTALCGTGVVTAAAQWVGIGGWGSVTVAQDGTETVCGIHGEAHYYAWYEIYGDSALNNGYQEYINASPVAPGDDMEGSVTYAQGTWMFAVADETAGWSFSTLVAWAPPALGQASAEFIVERNTGCATPTTCYPIAPFSIVPFTNASLISDGVAGTISSFVPVSVNGSNNGVPDATAGSLSADGSSFNITYDGP